MEQQPITSLLKRWHRGDRAAGDELIAVVYEQLKRMAGQHLRGERPDHTLEASALVHELYVRLSASEGIDWQNRAHFFAVATQQLRRILVNHARDAQAQKRGGKRVKLSLTQIPGLAQEPAEDLLYLHEALEELEGLNPRAARVIELRFFGGLSEEEAAGIAGVSLATLKRDWRFARAWLRDRLKEKPERA